MCSGSAAISGRQPAQPTSPESRAALPQADSAPLAGAASQSAAAVQASAAPEPPAAAGPAEALAEVRQRLHSLAREYVAGGGGPPLLTAKSLHDSIAAPGSSYFSADRRAYRALSKAAEQVDRAVAELDKRPAADFANASPRQAEALKVLGEAVKSLNALQDALRRYGETAPEAQARCLALGRSCAQRSAEMLNFAGLAASAGSPAVQNQTRDQAEGQAGGLPAPGLNWREHALDMHGNAGVLESVNARAAALFAELDALAADTAVDGSVADKAAQLKGKIADLRSDIARATESPALSAYGPAAGEPRLVREAELFAVISQGLTEAGKSVDVLAAMPGAQELDQMVSANLDDLCLVTELRHWTQAENMSFLNSEARGQLVELRDKFSAVAQALKEGISAFSPDSAQREPLQESAQGTLRGLLADLNVLYRELMPEVSGLVKDKTDRDAPANRLLALMGKMNMMVAPGHETFFFDALEELGAARGRLGVRPAFHSGVYLAKAFEGGVSIAALRECYARNIDPEYMELRADPGALAERRTLGSGAANTVTLCAFRDRRGRRTDLVFKPEYPARLGMGGMNLAGMGYGGKFHVLHLNLAAAEVAGAMGMQELMPESRAGTFEGRFGLFMSKAPGRTARDMAAAKISSPNSEENRRMRAELRENQAMDSARANLQRELCRLEWLDLLSGQLDRHPDNYMVDINTRTGAVQVTGIDNDAAFGAALVGAGKLDLSKLDLPLRDLKRGLEKAGLTLDEAAFHPPDPYILDLGKKGGAAFVRGTLSWNQLHIPSLIDRQSYDALMAINKDDYYARLEKHLDKDQVAAAMSRLDSAQALAEELQRSGKVVEDAQWGQGQLKPYDDLRSANRLLKEDDSRVRLPFYLREPGWRNLL